MRGEAVIGSKQRFLMLLGVIAVVVAAITSPYLAGVAQAHASLVSATPTNNDLSLIHI